MLGILIGIAAVILTVGLGEGAQGQVTSEITALGSNVLTITPGSSTSSTGIRGALGSASTLTMADVVRALDPRRRTRREGGRPDHLVLRRAGRRFQHVDDHGAGLDANWLTVRGRALAQGRFIDDQDISDHTATAVLGATTASELFKGVDPVGQIIDVGNGGVPLTVVGVLTSTGVRPLRPARHRTRTTRS